MSSLYTKTQQVNEIIPHERQEFTYQIDAQILNMKQIWEAISI